MPFFNFNSCVPSQNAGYLYVGSFFSGREFPDFHYLRLFVPFYGALFFCAHLFDHCDVLKHLFLYVHPWVKLLCN